MLINDNYHETLTSYQKEITRDPAKKHLLYLLQSTITICRLTQAACKKNWLLWTTLFPRWRWGKLSWILASWQVVGKVTMHIQKRKQTVYVFSLSLLSDLLLSLRQTRACVAPLRVERGKIGPTCLPSASRAIEFLILKTIWLLLKRRFGGNPTICVCWWARKT